MKITLPVRSLFAGLLGLLFVPLAVAQVSRSITFQNPAIVRAGSTFTVSVSASTNAADSEQIGFLHWDYSLDGGASWIPINYDYSLGKNVTRAFSVTAGGGNGTIKARARVAFRFGSAGDVNVNGGPIDWSGSWSSWQSPTSKEISIPVYQNFSYSILPVAVSGNKFLPRAQDGHVNTANLREVIQSLTNNHTSGKVLEFEAGIYEFNLDGSLSDFTNVGNLKLTGKGVRYSPQQTTLKWKHPNNPGTRGFIGFNSDCRNIEITNLVFDWDYEGNPRRADGTHLVIQGKHFTIEKCVFQNAPDWAITVGAGDQLSNSAAADPEYIHFNENHLINNFGDGIHVLFGKDIWIVGNVFDYNGDDHIALHNDLYATAGPGLGKRPENCHILWNYMLRTGFHGMRLTSLKNASIEGNYLDDTAHDAIQISNIVFYAQPGVPEVRGPLGEGILVSGNNIIDVGNMQPHLGYLGNSPLIPGVRRINASDYDAGSCSIQSNW